MLCDSIRRLERWDGHVGGGDRPGRIDVTIEQGGRLVADQVTEASSRRVLKFISPLDWRSTLDATLTRFHGALRVEWKR